MTTDTPTYDQLSALCAQMAAACKDALTDCENDDFAGSHLANELRSALTAYRSLSPDPQWQRVPEGCVVVPVDPSHEMINAAVFRAEQTSKKGTAMLRSAFSSIYQAFVQAAPSRARGEG